MRVKITMTKEHAAQAREALPERLLYRHREGGLPYGVIHDGVEEVSYPGAFVRVSMARNLIYMYPASACVQVIVTEE